KAVMRDPLRPRGRTARAGVPRGVPCPEGASFSSYFSAAVTDRNPPSQRRPARHQFTFPGECVGGDGRKIIESWLPTERCPRLVRIRDDPGGVAFASPCHVDLEVDP